MGHMAAPQSDGVHHFIGQDNDRLSSLLLWVPPIIDLPTQAEQISAPLKIQYLRVCFIGPVHRVLAGNNISISGRSFYPMPARSGPGDMDVS